MVNQARKGIALFSVRMTFLASDRGLRTRRRAGNTLDGPRFTSIAPRSPAYAHRAPLADDCREAVRRTARASAKTLLQASP